MTTLTHRPDTAEAVRAENSRLAVEFLENAVAGRAQEAMRRVAAPDFVHHNPYFAAGSDTISAAMDDDARTTPGKVIEVQRTIAEGPFVAVHSRLRQPAGRPDIAVVHLFRFEDGKVAEFWDVAREAPAQSPNPNGMF
jgi:predicted SnoaL-like aldol condensation-catalyzing enzyme